MIGVGTVTMKIELSTRSAVDELTLRRLASRKLASTSPVRS